MSAWLVVVAVHAAPCPPPSYTADQMRALARQEWRIADDGVRHALARSLLPCLASPDPEWRDDMALSALTAWLRAGAIATPMVRVIDAWARTTMAEPDAEGFGPPFAALLLAEVARVDRLQPFWTDDERQSALDAAARFMRDTRDYRGFDSNQGWRHAVAHGADVLMQLALNPRLTRAQVDQILDAVAAQAAPSMHAYVFGEGTRLARPVLFVARRGLHEADDWRAWLGRVARAGRADPAAPADLAMLNRQHNVRSLLLALYAAVREDGNPSLEGRLLPGLREALKAVW